jgi:hypothetical protein
VGGLRAQLAAKTAEYDREATKATARNADTERAARVAAIAAGASVDDTRERLVELDGLRDDISVLRGAIGAVEKERLALKAKLSKPVCKAVLAEFTANARAMVGALLESKKHAKACLDVAEKVRKLGYSRDTLPMVVPAWVEPGACDGVPDFNSLADDIDDTLAKR